jgi:diacylglycerol kinase family enzyme
MSSKSSVGAIVNVAAGACKRDPSLLRRLQQILPDGHLQATQKLEDLPPAIEALRVRNIETLAIVGGDGSIGGTLTALIRHWPIDRLPRIGAIRGGTVNTIAGSLGAKARPEVALQQLAAEQVEPSRPRPILQVTAGRSEPQYGMIFANGAAARWLAAYYSGKTGAAAAARLVVRTLVSIPVGSALSRQIFQPFKASMNIDEQDVQEETTLVACSAVRHLGLGFAPFETAGDHPDRFHCIWCTGPPTRLLREMPRFAMGRFQDSAALQHRAPQSVRLSLSSAEPYTIDAELFEAESEIRVDAGPMLSFLAP